MSTTGTHLAWTVTLILALGPAGLAQGERPKLTTGVTGEGDRFGCAVATDGMHAVVGALADDDGGFGAGSAWVFRRDDRGTPAIPGDDLWVLQADLVAGNVTGGQAFGAAVAVDGDHALVGAFGDDHAGILSGAAYVFRRDDADTPADPGDDTWPQQAKLIASDAYKLDEFGAHVALAGDLALVSSHEDDDAGPSSGSAYVFRRDDAGTPADPADDLWLQHAKLTAADGALWDHFGAAVALDASWAFSGAPDDDDGGAGAGAVYVFRREDGGTPADPADDTWVQHAKLGASDAAPARSFGAALALSGDELLVGSPEYSLVGTGAGSAYVFLHDDGGTPGDPADDLWVEQARLTAANAALGDGFGGALALGPDLLLVAATGTDGAAPDGGSVYAYQRDDAGTPADPGDDTWVQHVELVADDAGSQDAFGSALALAGHQTLVGAAWADDPAADSGATYDVWVATGPWSWLDQALPGPAGTPVLTAEGRQQGGDAVSLGLVGAEPGVPAVLVLGLSEWNVPFEGGWIVPRLDVLVAGLLTDEAGTLGLSGVWPTGVAAGLEIFYQVWFVGPSGFSATNALRSVTP